jgi:hypothetical protein
LLHYQAVSLICNDLAGTMQLGEGFSHDFDEVMRGKNQLHGSWAGR